MNRLETHTHVQIKEHLRKNTPKCPGIPSLPPTSTNKSRDVYKIIPQSFLGCQLHTGGIWGTLGDAPSMKSWQCPQLPGHTSSPPSLGALASAGLLPETLPHTYPANSDPPLTSHLQCLFLKGHFLTPPVIFSPSGPLS